MRGCARACRIARFTSSVAAGVSLAAISFAAARSGLSPAQPIGFVTILGDNPSPLTRIHIGDEMSFQCYHRTVPGAGQIYPSTLNSPADMGVIVRIGNTLYAPNFAMHGGTANGLGATTPWTPVSISAPSGDGTIVTPYSYTVTADAGASGLRLVMTVSYANTDNWFRHDLQFINQSGAPITFDTFLASDIYLANSDNGTPLRIASTGSIGGQDCTSTPVYRVLHIPLTPADRYTAKNYGNVWAQISLGGLNNTMATGCFDNGAALQWDDRTVQPGASLVIQAATSFGDIPPIALLKAPCRHPHTVSYTAGTIDAFVGQEPTAPRAELATYVPFAVRPFDLAAANLALAHTFVGLPRGILAGRLNVFLRPQNDGPPNDCSSEQNDAIALQYTGIPQNPWQSYRRIGRDACPPFTAGYLPGQWEDSGAYAGGVVISLDLGALPQANNTTKSLLANINTTGYLDVFVQDDTNVDYMTLELVVCPCVDPPPSMVGWYMFDTTLNFPLQPNAVGGTLANGYGAPAPVFGQFVGDSLNFNGVNQEVRVLNAGELNFGMSDLSIDAWIKTTAQAGIQVIADKRQPTSLGALGYRFFLSDGYLGFTLADPTFAGQTDYLSNDVAARNQLIDGSWRHVAASVKRQGASKLLTLYQDGRVIAQFNPSGKLGNLNSGWPVTMGHGYETSGPVTWFSGNLDEVEFFRRALTAYEVLSIYAAGQGGKCKEACHVKFVEYSFPSGGAVVHLLVCNYTNTSQSYNWSIAGVPASGDCNIDGSLVPFSPTSGSVVVPARKCVTVTIGTSNAALSCTDRACFEVTLTNVNSGEIETCEGSVGRACIVPATSVDANVIARGAPGSGGQFASEFIALNLGGLSMLDYEIIAIDPRTGLAAASISLDGLPAGTASTGQFNFVGGLASVPFTGEFVDYDAFAIFELTLFADADADGVRERLAVIPVLLDPAPDCNQNGLDDPDEVIAGTVTDCDTNGVPDSCDVASGADCNANGIPDACDIAGGAAQDCNGNALPDACDIAAGASGDCDSDGVPDECELDCNANATPDDCDIAGGYSLDLNLNGVPDECEAGGSVTSYCTAGTSTNGCVASMSAVGTPSASAASSFVLNCTGVEGQKAGLIFYGVNGPLSAPWSAGSSSFLCVKAPTQRTGSQNAGGTSNLCDGTLSLDWNLFQANHPGALGQPFAAGQSAWAQAWYRDPPAQKTTNLSNGLTFILAP